MRLIPPLLCLLGIACDPMDTPNDASGDRSIDAADSDDHVRVNGLNAEVEIHFDPEGLPHMYCGSAVDCATGIGFVHARLRLFQMHIARLQVYGRLTELFGDAGFTSDTQARLTYRDPTGTPIWERMEAALSPEARAELMGYAAGVNAAIERYRLGDPAFRLSEEYDDQVFGDDPLAGFEPWTVEDALAVVGALFVDSAESSIAETVNTLPAGLLEPDTYADIFLPSTRLGTSILSSGRGTRALTHVELPSPPLSFHPTPSQSRTWGRIGQRVWPRPGPDYDAVLAGGLGSNNWAISSARTSGGHATIANDPHGSFGVQPFLLPMHVERAGTTRFAFAVPGAPLDILGVGDHVGWGCTTPYADNVDVYRETLTPDGDGVVFRGSPVAFVVREESFRFPDGSVRTVELRWVPHHGAVIDFDATTNAAVTLRSYAREVHGSDYDALRALASATDVDDAIESVRAMTMLACNLTIADDSGRVAWRVSAPIPSRPWASMAQPPWLPLPGDGSAEWGEVLPPQEHPELIDPAAGWVGSANNAFDLAWSDGDPFNDGHPYWDTNFVPDYRMARIAERLDAAFEASPQLSVEMQSDVLVMAARDIVPALLAAGEGGLDSAAADALVSVLSEWNGTCPTGLRTDEPTSSPAPEPERSASIGCTVFHTVALRLAELSIRDELRAGGLDSYYSFYLAQSVVSALIAHPERFRTADALWDNVETEARENQTDILRRALLEAAEQLGPRTDEWIWGRVHTLNIRSFLSSPALAFERVASPGGGSTLNPGAGPWDVAASGTFPHTAGAYMRMVIELSRETPPTVLYQYAGGMDLDREGPFFDNLLVPYLRGEARQPLLAREAVRSVSALRFDLQPAP